MDIVDFVRRRIGIARAKDAVLKHLRAFITAARKRGTPNDEIARVLEFAAIQVRYGMWPGNRTLREIRFLQAVHKDHDEEFRNAMSVALDDTRDGVRRNWIGKANAEPAMADHLTEEQFQNFLIEVCALTANQDRLHIARAILNGLGFDPNDGKSLMPALDFAKGVRRQRVRGSVSFAFDADDLDRARKPSTKEEREAERKDRLL